MDVTRHINGLFSGGCWFYAGFFLGCLKMMEDIPESRLDFVPVKMKSFLDKNLISLDSKAILEEIFRRRLLGRPTEFRAIVDESRLEGSAKLFITNKSRGLL